MSIDESDDFLEVEIDLTNNLLRRQIVRLNNTTDEYKLKIQDCHLNYITIYQL